MEINDFYCVSVVVIVVLLVGGGGGDEGRSFGVHKIKRPITYCTGSACVNIISPSVHVHLM